MKKLYLIMCLIGFIAYSVLAVYKGQQGKLGYAICFAIISIAFYISLQAGIIINKINNNKSDQ